MDRKLDNASSEDAKRTTPDIKVTGDPNAWETIAKASSVSQGWMKSTKRMVVPGGWLFQVTTELREPGVADIHVPGLTHPGKVIACAEAVTFVPDPTISIVTYQTEIAALKSEVGMWKQRAAKHGCDTQNGDPDCV